MIYCEPGCNCPICNNIYSSLIIENNIRQSTESLNEGENNGTEYCINYCKNLDTN